MARKMRISKNMKKNLNLAFIFLIPTIIYIVLIMNIMNDDKINYSKADAILKYYKYEIVGKHEIGKYGDYYELINRYYNCEFIDKNGQKRYGYVVSSSYYTKDMDLDFIKYPIDYEIYYNDKDFEDGDEVFYYNNIPGDERLAKIKKYTFLFSIPIILEIGIINCIIIEYKKMKKRYG